MLWLEQRGGRKTAEPRKSNMGSWPLLTPTPFWKMCTCAYMYVYEPNNISMDCIVVIENLLTFNFKEKSPSIGFIRLAFFGNES